MMKKGKNMEEKSMMDDEREEEEKESNTIRSTIFMSRSSVYPFKYSYL